MAAPRWQREGDAQVDERYMDEWVEFGWAELVAYLTKWWKFDAWCEEHGRKEEPAA